MVEQDQNSILYSYLYKNNMHVLLSPRSMSIVFVIYVDMQMPFYFCHCNISAGLFSV